MKRFKTTIAAATFVILPLVWGQAQPQKQPQWKDRAEYDLYEAISKEPDGKKALALLDKWKEKYPSSEYAEARFGFYVDAYRKLNNAAKMMETAQAWLAANPKAIQALYFINLLTPSLNNTAPDALDASEKAGRSLLGNLDEFFAPEKKPASTSEADWKKARSDMGALANRTLGWVAWQRKNYPEATKRLTEDLTLNPADAEASAWLGTTIAAEKKAETYPKALFHFARAACYEGPGALDAARRKQMYIYVDKAYTTFHGKDPEGLQKLCAQTKTQALPPADFRILSSHEIAALKEKELAERDPQLAFWLKVKEALTAADGQTYFDTGMKDALVPPEKDPEGRPVPPLKGKLVRHTPAKNPKELVLALSDDATPEVTIKLDNPMVGAAPEGTLLQFRGVPKLLTREPFMVTFECEKEQVTGWPAPVSKKAAGKKAVKKKK